MLRLPLTIILAAMLAAPCAAEWQPDRFMISVWGCPNTPELAQAVADAGFNTVMCPARHLDLCAEFGLQSIVRDATFEDARRLREHPAVWGWFVQDEPKEPPSVADEVAAFHEADPDHPAYVNLVAWENLNEYIPIDLYIPGCPPKPEAMIEGVAKLVEVLNG